MALQWEGPGKDEETNDENFLILINVCKSYINIAEEYGDWDGRFFRRKFPYGYISMEELHNLSKTITDKTKEFKMQAKILTYPKFRFEDWNLYLKIEKYAKNNMYRDNYINDKSFNDCS